MAQRISSVLPESLKQLRIIAILISRKENENVFNYKS